MEIVPEPPVYIPAYILGILSSSVSVYPFVNKLTVCDRVQFEYELTQDFVLERPPPNAHPLPPLVFTQLE